jgi:hypothetical protein
MSGEVPPGLREIARCQGGIVSRRQAIAAGMTPGAIVAKVKYERWQQVYRGVYATFTGPPSREARLWAAVLYAGKGARLSHETAAELHGLADRPTPLIHLTVPATRRVRLQRGLVIHVSALLGEPPRFPPGILPRTPIEATVLDLVDAAGGIDEARAWITRACERGLTSDDRLRAAISTRSRLRWRHQLGQIVAAEAETARTRRSGQQRLNHLTGVGEVGQHGVRARGQQVGGLAGASRHTHGTRARR